MDRTPADAEHGTETAGTGDQLVGRWIMWPTIDDGARAVLVEEALHVMTTEGVPGPDPEILLRFAPISTEAFALAYPDTWPMSGPRYTRLFSAAAVTIADHSAVVASKSRFQSVADTRVTSKDAEAAWHAIRRINRMATVAGLLLAVAAVVDVLVSGEPTLALLGGAALVLASSFAFRFFTRAARRRMVVVRVREDILEDLAAGAPVRLHSVMGGHLWGVEGQAVKPGV